MHVFIVYAHPSEDSFTRRVRNAFIEGCTAAGHSVEISDLYKMNFRTDMSEAEYLRDANFNDTLPVESDVAAEQEKINRCEVIVFIYPVFWTEAPAKLVGWFNRVWSYGFAYGNRSMRSLKKGIVICTSGHPIGRLKEYGHLEAMKTVMINDRLFDRVASSEFIVLDGMTKADTERRKNNWKRHLDTAYETGRNL